MQARQNQTSRLAVEVCCRTPCPLLPLVVIQLSIHPTVRAKGRRKARGGCQGIQLLLSSSLPAPAMPPSFRYSVGVQPSPTPSASSSAAARVTTTRASKAPGLKVGSGGTNARKTLKEDVGIQDFGPPSWRTVLNRRADLGE